jgi:ribosomal protein S12 methylthiotransferase
MINSDSSKNVSVVTLGCAKNLVDSEYLVTGLKHIGYSMTNDVDKSSIVIINTCGFLDIAREESIDKILEIEEKKQKGLINKVIVMGCLAERYGDELQKEIPGVDKFFGSEEHEAVIRYISGKNFNLDDPDIIRASLTPSHYSYLKIAEGCDNACSFCSIPLMRGLQKSQPLRWNVEEAKRLASRGVKELLVIAQDSTSYGWDATPKTSLHELFSELDKIDKIEWLRLHYAHPSNLHREMIKSFGRLEKLIPYIDMPIQHGADKMLKIMKRGLKSDGIKRKIEALRKTNENIAIRTSIIVGHPGETDKEFQELLDFISDIEFDRLGVFQYSHEENTFAADTMKDEVPKDIKQERFDQMMAFQQTINFKKNKVLVGTNQKVLIDISKDGFSLGRTFRDSPTIDNYVKINQKLDVGKFYDVDITSAQEYDLIGKVKV